MSTTFKTLSALAIATAALTTLATAGAASAKPVLGHGPVIAIDGHPIGPSGGKLISCQLGKGCTVTPPPRIVTPCAIAGRCGTPPHNPPVTWGGQPPRYGSGYGWHDHWRWGWGWDHFRRWPRGPAIVVEGTPGAIGVSAPVQGAPSPAPVAQPLAKAEPCNCLTKQNLPDGSVMFEDICTKESAIATPQTVGAR